MRCYLREILLILLPIIFGNKIYTQSFFPPMLEGAIPVEFSRFVDRYLSEMVVYSLQNGDAERRMDFDEVEISFPLTQSALGDLAKADGVSLTMHMGSRYTIAWMKDSLEIARMSFPASYNLIHGTSQKESFNALLSQLALNTRVTSLADSRPVSCPDSLNIIRRDGHEFYLGYLYNHRWISALDARPVWSADFPCESLSNLFCIDNMPDTRIALEMEGYNMVRESISTTTSSLRHILAADNRCETYFGLYKSPDEDGMLTALVIYHNPMFAYLHKLDVTVDVNRLFLDDNQDECPIKATLYPYIKLHNLKNLWGENTKVPVMIIPK